jgi:hypothetical protein
MKRLSQKVPIRFVPTERFAVKPVPAAPFRAVELDALDRFKDRLVRKLLNTTTDAELHSRIRRAANDAASLAWMTGYPLLFFPLILEERIAMARRQARRQRDIRQRSRMMIEQIT